MGETLDFTGKILIDGNKEVCLIINAYRAVTWYDTEELIYLTCYKPTTKSYTIFLDPDEHEIESTKDYLGEEDYQRLAHFLVRERRTLLKSARERAVIDIVDSWGAYFRREIRKKNIKYPTLEWAKKSLKELEKCPEKYIVWELE